ncbi:MAG TPA: EamA family transporter [Candidatus Dormibacteraeota bacterium]|nr:EamA family transporter [Candidatus Dormibacteraeota bacterium]
MLLVPYITFKAGIGQELRTGFELISVRPGYLLVLLSALSFALGGNAAKALFKLGFSPLLLAQLRIWWAFAWLVISLLVIRPSLLRVRRDQLLPLAVFGTVGLAAVQLSYYLTIARLNIAVALLVQYLGLVGITAWERYHRREVVGRQVWIALVMVLVGAFLAVGAYQPALLRVNLPGVLLGLLSAVFLAFYMLRASTLARRLDTWTILVYGFGAGSLLWFGYDIVTRTGLPTDGRIWVAMALIGLLGTLLGHALFLAAVRTIRASAAGIVSTAEPVFAGLIAFLVFGDRLQPLQVLGAAVIIAGIVTVQAATRDLLVTAPIPQ